MELFGLQSGSVFGILGSIGLLVGGWFTRKYVVPYLKVGKRQKYARWIATLADDLTDELRARYPDRKWINHLDEVVDRLIEMCGINSEIAWRAVRAAAARGGVSKH